MGDAVVGLLAGNSVGTFVGGLGSPLRHAPLGCPLKAPLQHSNALL